MYYIRDKAGKTAFPLLIDKFVLILLFFIIVRVGVNFQLLSL